MTDLAPLDDLELAALGHAWELWARPKQLAPETAWRSWGLVTGRGFGKTRSCAELVVEEIMAGRARRVGFCSFNLAEAPPAGPAALPARPASLDWCSGAQATPKRSRGQGEAARPVSVLTHARKGGV